MESASRVTVCRRRLVYGAKIYTYTHLHIHTDTHTRALIDNTYRRIHCKCKKFLLLSFVALFVCIAPSVLRCVCVYECMHLCACECRILSVYAKGVAMPQEGGVWDRVRTYISLSEGSHTCVCVRACIN